MFSINDILFKGVRDSYHLDRSFGGSDCAKELTLEFKLGCNLLILTVNFFLFRYLTEKKTEDATSSSRTSSTSHARVAVFGYEQPICPGKARRQGNFPSAHLFI